MSPDAILEFWFGDALREPGAALARRQLWFRAPPDFDREVGQRFGPWIELAAAGELDAWCDGARSALALVLLLDQFPRNVFRDTPLAFASDAKALEVALAAIAAGFDAELHRSRAASSTCPSSTPKTSASRNSASSSSRR